ncbi:MAG: hypothetical protein IPM54_08345 [Polyangiaceae bacterium]|nr:hypothetical protein [Polyangiaceae bacterium]
MRKRAIISAISTALFLCNCLPGDTRPPPGRLHLSAEPAAETLSSISTADGWTIELYRFLVTMGGAELEGDACTDYANARYSRLFDFLVPERQKVCELYGLGDCNLEIRLRSPWEDALLQKGVTASDLEFMLKSDLNIPLPAEVLALGGFGTTVFLRGQAIRAGETKQFEWKFPSQLNLTDCGFATDTSYVSDVTIREGDDFKWVIAIHVEELFRELPEDGAPLRFDQLAATDVDGDGTITMTELLKAKAPVIEMEGEMPELDLDDEEAFGHGMMAGYLSQIAMARIVYLDGRPCKQARSRRWR